MSPISSSCDNGATSPRSNGEETGAGDDSSEGAVGDKIDGARRNAPPCVASWNLVPTPKRNGAGGAARRGRAGASAERMTRDGKSSIRGSGGTGGGGTAAGGGGSGGVRGRRTGVARPGLADIPRSVSIEGVPTVAVGVVGVDGVSFSSSTRERGLGLDGVDAGVDEAEGGGLGKRSKVGLTIVSKKFASYIELLRLATPVLASIVRSDTAVDTLARDTSDGLRLSSKGASSDENVSGITPPASSASAASRPFGCPGETTEEGEEDVEGTGGRGNGDDGADEGEMYSVLTDDASVNRLPLSV